MHKDLICIKIFDNFTVNFERAFRRSLFAKELKKNHTHTQKNPHYGLRETGSSYRIKKSRFLKISYTKN